MGQQPQSNTQTGWEDVPTTQSGGWEDAPTLENLIANPNKQGTYRMLPPAETEDYGKSGLMVPYGNIQAARKVGFNFDPDNGDATRFAHDLFTQLSSAGQAPPVHRLLSRTWGMDANTSDQTSMQKYGVIPAPAFGSNAWLQNVLPSKDDLKFGGLKTTHAVVDSLPAIGAGLADVAVGVPGTSTGPGDIALVAAANAGGAAIGETGKQYINSKFFDETLTPKERAERIAEQAAFAGVMGPGGRIVAKPLAKLQNYLNETMDVSNKAGFRMLPSEAHGTTPTIFETYPKGSIFTSGKMAKWRDLQNQEAEAAARKLADNISATSLSATGSREEAGNVIRDGIESHMAAFAQQQNLVYRQIETQAEAAGVQVARKDVVDFAKKELGRINRVQGETGGGGPTDSFRKQLEGIISNPNQFASYTAMKDFRTALLAEARSMNSLLSNPEKAVVDKLASITGDAIENGLKNSKAPNLASVWRTANDVTREEKETFVQNLVKNLADKKNPEDIALVLRGNSPSAIAPIGIQETRDALSVIPQQMIPKVQKQILLDTIYEATGKGSQPFDEGIFSKKILQIGDDRGQVLFGKHWGNIKEFSELVNKIKNNGGLTGASLSNPEVVKQVTRLTGEAFLAGLGGHLSGVSTIGASLIPIAGEAALWRTVASALTNPAMAEKLLNTMRVAVRVTPYLGYGMYDSVKPMNDKVKEYLEKAKSDLTPPTKSPNASPKELIERSKQLNSTSPGPQSYNHTAVNPLTGHMVASNNGVDWVDAVTGQPMA